MIARGKAAAAALRAWSQIRGPVGSRPGAPATRWAVIAAGLAAGGALEVGGARGSLVVVCLVMAGALAAAQRRDPVPRWARPQLALLFAAALLAGGLRADALAPAPLAPGAVRGAAVELQEPLSPASGRGAIADLIVGERRARVLVVASRYAEPGSAAALPAGARLTVDGTLRTLAAATGSGDRTGRAVDRWLARQRVVARLHATEITWAGGRRGGLLGAIDRAGERAERQLSAWLGERRGALVAGMALGRADRISDGDAAMLRTSGLWHLVAASGGNIALVVALALGVGWLLGAGDRTRLASAALAVVAYVPLAGGGPSIQRAGVMGLAALAALWLGREHRAREGLALAAAATLALHPAAWQDVGWQLSFAAAAALIFVAPRTVAALIAAGLPRWLALALAITGVATLATAPITLATFGEVSMVGLLTNLAVGPMVAIVVWSGVLALLVAVAAPAAGALVAAPAGWAGALILTIGDWGAGRTHAVAGLREVAILAVVVAGLVVLGMPRRWLLIASAVAGSAALLVSPGAPREPRLLVLDIGQGSAALLQQGRDGILVDTGPRGAGIVALLRRSGVRRLRAVILSHPAADHDGGAAEVLEAFPTALLLDGGAPEGGPTREAGLRVARRRGIPVAPLRAGQRLTLGQIQVQVLWPTAAAIARAENPNDRSGVLTAQIGGLRALLPGDAESNVLTQLKLARTDILALSHHGSRDAQLPATLRRTRPAAGVVSVGASNGYGHPAPETLAQLADAGVPVMRTDQTGSVAARAERGRVLLKRGPSRPRR